MSWQFVYIHGFNGSPCGPTLHALGKELNASVHACSYDYSRSWRECLARLEAQIAAFRLGADQKLCVFGGSLGGFYAMQLRRAPLDRVVVWNPVIYPAAQLARLVGENTRFIDGRRWIFTPAALYSYARAPDPREWKNSHWRELAEAGVLLEDEPRRAVILGENDELLDWRLAKAFWEGHAPVASIQAPHGLTEFSQVFQFLD